MKKELENTEHWVALYLAGSLTEEELLDKTKLTTSELEELRMKRYLGDGLNKDELLEFHRKLLERKQGEKDKPDTIREPRSFYRWAAAGIMLALAVMATLYGLSSSWEREFDSEIVNSPLSCIEVFRDDTSSESDYLNELIERKQYKSALDLIQTSKELPEFEAAFLSGLMYFQLEDWDSASWCFRDIIQHNDNLYVYDALWLDALACISAEKKHQAIKNLKEISIMDGPRQDQAKSWLRNLKNRNWN